MARLKEPQVLPEENNEAPIVQNEAKELPSQDENVTPEQNLASDEKPDDNFEHDEYLKAEIQELKQELEHEKIKETQRKKLIRVLLYLVIIVGGIFAVLFLISRAALYDSIGSMLSHMWGELQLMGERIFR